MAGNLDEVTDNNFQAEVLEADKPVLVDFWAPWCGPCRIIAPHLEELNDERDDLRVVKLNVDDNPQTAAQYDVMSIPTLILFKNGQAAHQIIGALPKTRLVQELEPALEPAAASRTFGGAVGGSRGVRRFASRRPRARGSLRRASSRTPGRTCGSGSGPSAPGSDISLPSRMKLPKISPPIAPRTKQAHSASLRCSIPPTKPPAIASGPDSA